MSCNLMEERRSAHAAFIRRNAQDPSIAALFTMVSGRRLRARDGLESVKKSQQVAACVAGKEPAGACIKAIQPGPFH
jgi:hypothetical protein